MTDPTQERSDARRSGRRESAAPSAAFRKACLDGGLPEDRIAAAWSLHSQRGADGTARWPMDAVVDDLRLWRDFVGMRDGDEPSSRRFHEHWSARIRAFCGQRVSKERCDELAARFFERTWRLVPRDYAWSSPFSAYLHVVIVNLVRDDRTRQNEARTKERSLTREPRVDGGSRETDLVARDASPEQVAIDSEMVARVREALLELSAGDQHIVVACLVDGVPGQEMAERLGIDRNALYQRLHRARKRLEERLAEDGVLPRPRRAAAGRKGKA